MATVPELLNDIVKYIFEIELKERTEEDAIMEWRYRVAKGMDVHLFPSDWYRDVPSGFRFNWDEDHELRGWFWFDETTGSMKEPFVGADAIVSFLLIKAQREVPF